jgi:NADH-quinone oxidoreductase subunit F
VSIETGRKLGSDFTLADLKEQGYDAVFLAVGAPLGVSLNIPGATAQGVTEAMSFLRHYNIRGSVPVGKHVAVIGGGNAAIDAARTAVRLGARSVTVVYRRTREEMPAYAEEIDEALQEGIILRTLVHPESFVVDNGFVTGLRLRPMHLGEFDRSGRRRPESGDDACEILPADQVIVAIGQALDKEALAGGVEIEYNERGWIKADPRSGATSVPWLFAGGDAVIGPSSVVEAIAAGERAAVAIDAMLTGETHAFWRGYQDAGATFDPNADPVPYARERLPTIALEKRRQNFNEVEQPWNESTALRQAKRCLRCDYGKQPCGLEHA